MPLDQPSSGTAVSISAALAVADPIKDVMVKRGTADQSIDLAQVFGSGDLTFTVESADPNIAAVTVQGSQLTVDFLDALGHSDIRVTATDAEGSSATDSFRVRVTGGNAYTIAVMPDTQDYALNPSLNHTFYEMTQWLVDNKESHNIQFVTHIGDVTYHNTDAEWAVAKQAFSTLDGEISYALLPGNHDLAPGGSAAFRDDKLSQYFTVEDRAADPTFGGVYDGEPNSYANNYHTFTAPDGTKWLVLSLEFGPRDDVLRWAGEVIEGNLDHRVIISTHSNMAGDERVGPVTEQLTGENGGPSYGVGNSPEGSADGDQIWDSLVGKYPNISFVFSGHNFIDGAETQIDYGAGGQPVLQMLMNYQNGISREITGNGNEAEGNNGGNGAIRLVTIDPENNAVYTETYFVEYDDYLDGYRGQEELDRDGLTGPYRGHQETFENIDLSAPEPIAVAKAGADLLVDAGEADTGMVALDATATIVPDGLSAEYVWMDADGKVIATGAQATVELGVGARNVTLEVRDSAGHVTTDQLRVTIANQDTLLVDDFNDGDFAGWTPPSTVKLAEFGTPAAFDLPALPGGSAEILSFPHYTRQQYLALDPEVAAPGADGLIWSYSLVMDILVPAAAGGWTSIFQTNLSNGNDAEIYLRNDGDGTGSLGISGVYQGDFQYDQWQRVALTFERQGTSNTVVISKYIDGQLVGQQTSNDAFRFSIDAATGILLFSDDDSDTTSGYVNSVLFSDRVLSGAEIAGFGAADADGILATPIAGATQFDFTDGALAASWGPGKLSVPNPAATTPFKIVGTVASGAENGEGSLVDLTNAGEHALIWNAAGADEWQDYVFQATLRSTDSSGRLGVLFYYQDEDNHYRLTFDADGNARALVKIQNGVETVLAQIAQGHLLAADLELRVAIVGGEIRVLLDGHDVFDGPVVDSDPLSGGTVGVITENQDVASFDNIVVNKASLTAHGEGEFRTLDGDGDGVAEVALTAGGSFGPDAIVAYRWLLDGEEIATGRDVTVELPTGTRELTLEITDAAGRTSTDLVKVDVVSKTQVLLSDGFGGALTDWTVIDEGEFGDPADWQVQDGKLVQLANVWSRQLTNDWNATDSNLWERGWSPLGDGDYILRKGTYAVYDGAGARSWKNYSVEATLSAAGNDAIGLLFYYQDADNYYKLELDNETGLYQLLRLVDGVESIVDRTAGRYAPSSEMQVRVDILDHKIQVFLDGEAIFTDPIEDHGHDGGTVALYSWGAQGAMSFDDVTVVSLEAPETPEDQVVTGTRGNDVLAGAAGDDTLDGGYGNDMLGGGEGDDRLDGGYGNDGLDGGSGKDVLKGGYGDDQLDGSAGDDALDGGYGNDALVGGNGNDGLAGGYGNDVLAGAAGDDTLDGGYGDDRLIGGAGNDVMTGGRANDTFVFAAGFGTDRITDFGKSGNDVIEFEAAIFADFDAVKAHSTQVGADVVIALDQDDVLTLVGVKLASLHDDDFRFVA